MSNTCSNFCRFEMKLGIARRTSGVKKAARNKEREEEARCYSHATRAAGRSRKVRDQLRDKVRDLELSAKVQDGELAKAKAVWEEKERNKNDEIMNLRGDLKEGKSPFHGDQHRRC